MNWRSCSEKHMRVGLRTSVLFNRKLSSNSDGDMEIADLALSIDEQNLVGSLEKARKGLEPESQLMLDLSSIRRIDSRGLRALQELVHQAEEIKGKVVLR